MLNTDVTLHGHFLGGGLCLYHSTLQTLDWVSGPSTKGGDARGVTDCINLSLMWKSAVGVKPSNQRKAYLSTHPFVCAVEDVAR